jgi:alpha-ketoglutarate-dependent taurine dioxygenase
MPEIYIVSNVKMNGQPIGSLGDGEAVWHTDMSYLDMPPKASMLYALEVPPTGGNTSFCSMYRIYEALPVTLKDRITGKPPRVLFDFAVRRAGPTTEGPIRVVASSPVVGRLPG